MQSLEIGDSKPSDLYQRMKQLLSDANPDTFFFRQMFLQKLPPVIQQIIAVISSPDAPMDQLVEKADKAYEIHSNYRTISAISSPPAPVHSTAPSSSQSMEDRFTLAERKINDLCSEIQHLRSRERPRSKKAPELPAPDAVSKKPPMTHASTTPTSKLQPASANLLVNFQKSLPARQ